MSRGLAPIPAPALAPAQRFDEQVAQVRQSGDPLDLQRRFRHRPALLAGGITGLTTGVMLAESYNVGLLDESANPTVNATVIALAGLAGAAYAARRRNLAAGRERYNQPTQEAVGQSYELYTANRRNRDKTVAGRTVDMRWYGRTDATANKPGDGLNDLTFIATLAKRAGVRSIAIGDSLAQQLTPTAGQPTQTMAQMLRRAGMRVGGRAKRDMIHVKTPDEWLDAVQTEQKARGHSLDGLLAMVEKYGYDYPLARVAREFKGRSGGLVKPLRDKALLNAATAGIQRQLSGAESGRVRRGDPPSRNGLVGSLAPNGDVHQLTVGVDSVEFNATDLNRALGVTDESLQAAIDNAENNPHEALRALEVLVYKTLKGSQKAQTNNAAVGNQKVQDSTTPYQAELLNIDTPDLPARNLGRVVLDVFTKGRPERVGRDWARVRRATTFLLTATAMTAGGAAGGYVANNEFFKHRDREMQKLAHERDVSWADISYMDPELLDRLGPWQPLAYLDQALVNGTVALDLGPSRWEPPRVYTGPEFDMSNHESATDTLTEVGNVNDVNEPNRPQWHLDPVNMTTDGYWATAVGNTQNTYVPQDDSGLRTFWDHEDELDRNLTVTALPLAVPAGTTQFIGVSRLLSYNDLLNQNSVNYTAAQRIYIPVLEGTKPIAATIGGRPLELVQREDGTYYLQLTSGEDKIGYDMDGNLTYWLAPTEDAANPRMAGERDTRLHDTEYNAAEVDQAWEAIIPGLPAADGTAATDLLRTKIIGEYIQASWNYALQPWEHGSMQGVRTGGAQAARANEMGAANCNVTAGLLVEENKELAPVMGYLNKGNGEGGRYLSTHDRHMWVADRSGNRYDYTPNKGLTAEDAAYFAENYNYLNGESGSNGNLWLYAQLAALAAGVGIWRRRDIARGVRAVAGQLADIGEKRLGELSPEELTRAYSLISQAAFAPTVSVQSAERSINYGQGDPGETIAKLLRNSGLHTPAAQRTLKAAARAASSRTDAQTIRDAAKIARRVGRVQSRRRQSQRSVKR